MHEQQPKLGLGERYTETVKALAKIARVASSLDEEISKLNPKSENYPEDVLKSGLTKKCLLERARPKLQLRRKRLESSIVSQYGETGLKIQGFVESGILPVEVFEKLASALPKEIQPVPEGGIVTIKKAPVKSIEPDDNIYIRRRIEGALNAKKFGIKEREILKILLDATLEGNSILKMSLVQQTVYRGKKNSDGAAENSISAIITALRRKLTKYGVFDVTIGSEVLIMDEPIKPGNKSKKWRVSYYLVRKDISQLNSSAVEATAIKDPEAPFAPNPNPVLLQVVAGQEAAGKSAVTVTEVTSPENDSLNERHKLTTFQICDLARVLRSKFTRDLLRKDYGVVVMPDVAEITLILDRLCKPPVNEFQTASSVNEVFRILTKALEGFVGKNRSEFIAQNQPKAGILLSILDKIDNPEKLESLMAKICEEFSKP